MTRVEPVAGEPLGRLVPDLADDVGLRVDGAAAAAELLPERLVADLGRHVQAPAVDAEAQPVLGDARTGTRGPPGSSVLSLGSAGRPHHASVAQAPDGLVAARVVGHAGDAARRGRRPDRSATDRAGTGRVPSSAAGSRVEPVAVRRPAAVLQHVVERPEAAPGVVEHAVEHDPDAAGVRRVEQLAQGRVAAEQRVHLEVVVRVVAVVRRRREDRRQVQRVDAQVREVGQVLGDSPAGRRP